MRAAQERRPAPPSPAATSKAGFWCVVGNGSYLPCGLGLQLLTLRIPNVFPSLAVSG